MNTAIAERNILVKDADGNWYSIPSGMEQEFIRLKEDTINAEFGTAEWHTANAEMQEAFGAYLK